MEDRVRIREQVLEGVTNWVWPLEDEGAWLGPSQEFVPIREAIRTKVRDRKLIVQAGGCCGMYPRLFSDWFETVITFEPAPLSWYCLERNCLSDKIIKFNAALGDIEGTVFLDLANPSNVGMNAIRESAQSIPVRQMTIDALDLPACDAIQLDVEGYEMSVLIGATQTITKFRPIISLETRNPDDAVHHLLLSQGYQVCGTTTNDTIFSPIIGS